jgi:pimeloyl-ACP methyl ester carboxylesterase
MNWLCDTGLSTSPDGTLSGDLAQSVCQLTFIGDAVDFTENSFKLDARVINFAAGPDSGSPMVWLHGLSGRWQRWRETMQWFAPHHQQFALDARGHGKSSRVPGRYTWLDHAEDANAFVREKVSERAILIGHSLGAMQAIKVAADQPDKIAAVILEDPPLYAAERPQADFSAFVAMEQAVNARMTAEQILQVWPGESWMTDAIRREYTESLTELDAENLRVTINLEATRKYSTDANLNAIQCPLLMMRAVGSSPVLSAEEQDRALAHLKQGRGVTIQQPHDSRRASDAVSASDRAVLSKHRSGLKLPVRSIP